MKTTMPAFAACLLVLCSVLPCPGSQDDPIGLVPVLKGKTIELLKLQIELGVGTIFEVCPSEPLEATAPCLEIVGADGVVAIDREFRIIRRVDFEHYKDTAEEMNGSCLHVIRNPQHELEYVVRWARTNAEYVTVLGKDGRVFSRFVPDLSDASFDKKLKRVFSFVQEGEVRLIVVRRLKSDILCCTLQGKTVWKKEFEGIDAWASHSAAALSYGWLIFGAHWMDGIVAFSPSTQKEVRRSLPCPVAAVENFVIAKAGTESVDLDVIHGCRDSDGTDYDEAMMTVGADGPTQPVKVPRETWRTLGYMTAISPSGSKRQVRLGLGSYSILISCSSEDEDHGVEVLTLPGNVLAYTYEDERRARCANTSVDIGPIGKKDGILAVGEELFIVRAID